MRELWIQPTGGALGADVCGIDLSEPVSDAVFERIAAAWSQHLVLRFSGQRIDDHMLMTFSARFGELDRVPVAAAKTLAWPRTSPPG
jgi:taurine dioxygenase